MAPGIARLLLIFATVAGGYAVICALMYVLQGKLLFHPRANDPVAVHALSGDRWQLDRPDAAVTGFVRAASRPAAAPLVLYFGGNAEDVASSALQQRADANFLYLNYRGYGDATGTPGQDVLFSDALAAFDAARATITSNGRVVVMGRSLGSGVAVYVAAHRSVEGVILVTPFDSMVNVAAGFYPWLPVRWLLIHRFESDALAPDIEIPALFLIAERDQVVAAQRGLALQRVWGGPTTVSSFPRASHNSVQDAPGYDAAIAQFLGRFR